MASCRITGPGRTDSCSYRSTGRLGRLSVMHKGPHRSHANRLTVYLKTTANIHRGLAGSAFPVIRVLGSCNCAPFCDHREVEYGHTIRPYVYELVVSDYCLNMLCALLNLYLKEAHRPACVSPAVAKIRRPSSACG